jgi:hypothetical protein
MPPSTAPVPPPPVPPPVPLAPAPPVPPAPPWAAVPELVLGVPLLPHDDALPTMKIV